MAKTMSSSREIEHRSASAATFSPTTALLTPTAWRTATDADRDGEFASLLSKESMADYAAGGAIGGADQGEEDTTRAIKCTALSPNQTIRISPMERTRGGWDQEHFHTNLRVPEGNEVGRGMVVMLEGE
jgi:hypothetical protein